MPKKDPLEFLRSKGVDMTAVAKAMGYDDDEDEEEPEDDEDEKGCKPSGMSKSEQTVVDADALRKGLDQLEAAAAREAPAVDPEDLFAPAQAAAQVDATGLLKSLVDANQYAAEGMGQVLDELGQQIAVGNTLAQAGGHLTLRLVKSIEGIQAGQAQQVELTQRLLKALGAPDQALSVTSAQGAPAPTQITRPVARFPAEDPAARRAAAAGTLTKARARGALLEAQRAAIEGKDQTRIYEIEQHVIAFESSGGVLSPAARQIVDQHLGSAPAA